jgi:hypothetical protein
MILDRFLIRYDKHNNSTFVYGILRTVVYLIYWEMVKGFQGSKPTELLSVSPDDGYGEHLDGA